MQWGMHKIRNVLMVLLLTALFVFCVITLVLFELVGISFKSMILFKGLTLSLPFLERLSEFWESVASVLNIRLIFDVFQPLLGIIQLFAYFTIDFEFLQVTCPGASSPYELAINKIGRASCRERV